MERCKRIFRKLAVTSERKNAGLRAIVTLVTADFRVL